MRAIRKVTSYICTTCYQVFPTSDDARAHYRKAHGAPDRSARRTTRRRGETSAGRVLKAIEDGASSAKEIQKRTKLPLKRVHSFLTYLRKQGRIEGYRDDLRVAAKIKQ